MNRSQANGGLKKRFGRRGPSAFALAAINYRTGGIEKHENDTRSNAGQG
jgi:hypothetical protein